MPWIAALVGSFFSKAVLRVMLIRVVALLGISAVGFAGFGTLMTTAENYVLTNLAGMQSNIVSMFNMVGVTDGINLIFWAWSGRMALKGLSSAGAISKVFFVPGGGANVFVD